MRLTLQKHEIPPHLLKFFKNISPKPKDELMIPHRVYQALMEDGWYGRADIIWSKPNPMPESVTDRPTRSHEYLFLFAKSKRYYYDAAAIAEKATNGERFHGGYDKSGMDSRTKARNGRSDIDNMTATRNRRTVWTIATRPLQEVHYAAFPEALVEPCILAGSRPGDTVLDPFVGSGTTCRVAERFGRNAIGIDLGYAELQNKRTNGVQVEMEAYL